MIRIILSGANGAMGHVLADMIGRRSDCTVAFGIDVNTQIYGGFHIFSRPDDCPGDADVIIDFSHPAALEPLLDFAQRRSLPVVVATTGLSGDQVDFIRDVSHRIPIFYSANMSLGINLMVELIKTATRVLGGQFDIEVVEKHHNRKIDAPSGTALMLTDAMSAELEHEPQYIYDRHSQRKKRSEHEIGIHTVRGGTIVGEHEVLFAGRDEILTVSHTANSRDVFATGAVNAACFLRGQKPGLYDMSDLIAQRQED